VSRAPLPLGTWGKIRAYVVTRDDRSRPTRHRAITKYRDYDGVTRQVEATGPTRAKAENRLRDKLRTRTTAARAGELTAQPPSSSAGVRATGVESAAVTHCVETASLEGAMEAVKDRLAKKPNPLLGDRAVEDQRDVDMWVPAVRAVRDLDGPSPTQDAEPLGDAEPAQRADTSTRARPPVGLIGLPLG